MHDQTLRSAGNQPGIRRRIARIAEIPDPADQPIAPVQHDKIGRTVRSIRLEHQNGRLVIDEPLNEAPVRPALVILEVASDILAAVPPAFRDEIEPDIIGQQVAQRVEIPRIEALDIGRQTRPLRFVQDRMRRTVRLLRQFAQTHPPLVQRRLHRGDAQPRDLGNLLQRMAENVHQDHAAAMRWRQLHEGAQAGGGDLMLVHDRDGIGHRIRIVIGMQRAQPAATPEKIQRGVVDDPEHPALHIDDGARGRKRLDRFQHRVLNHVLAVDRRAGHARGVTVQLRAQFAEHPVKGAAGIHVRGGQHAHAPCRSLICVSSVVHGVRPSPIIR